MDPISIRVAWGRLKGNYCIQVSYNLLCSGQGELCAGKNVFLAMSVLSLNELVGLLPVVHFTPAGEKLLGIMVSLVV
jgi:hypothetical protein